MRTKPKRMDCIYMILLKFDLLLRSPGHVLQHLPGNNTGSSHVGFGHSFFIFLHAILAIIRRFLWTWKGSKKKEQKWNSCLNINEKRTQSIFFIFWENCLLLFRHTDYCNTDWYSCFLWALATLTLTGWIWMC